MPEIGQGQPLGSAAWTSGFESESRRSTGTARTVKIDPEPTFFRRFDPTASAKKQLMLLFRRQPLWLLPISSKNDRQMEQSSFMHHHSNWIIQVGLNKVVPMNAERIKTIKNPWLQFNLQVFV